MRDTVAAVLHGLRHRPAVWLVCGLGWVLYGTVNATVIPFVVYRATGPSAARDELLPGLLPAALPGSVLGAYPLFGAIYMVVLGGLVVGNEYRWNTIGTLLVQRPSRTAVAIAQAAALAVVTLVTALGFAAAHAVASVAIAVSLGVPVTPPASAAVLGALGGSWLIAFVYAMIGAFVAHLFRSALAAVAAALVLVVVLENLVGLLAGFVPALQAIRYVLPGPSGGALAVALGASGSTPGVAAVAPVWAAVTVLAAWAVLAVAGSAAVLRRRDVTA